MVVFITPTTLISTTPPSITHTCGGVAAGREVAIQLLDLVSAVMMIRRWFGNGELVVGVFWCCQVSRLYLLGRLVLFVLIES